MKVLQKVTVSHLKRNKKRTIVTVIGIILATALLTAVVSMAVSLRQNMISYLKQQNGDYHIALRDQDGEMLEQIKNFDKVDSMYEMTGLGYAKLEKSLNDYKPYLYVTVMNKEALEDSSVQLIEGRYPENDKELMISKTLETDGGVEYKVGDTLTLSVGERVAVSKDKEEDGERLTQSVEYRGDGKEKVLPGEEHTYTIVGVMERLSTVEEPFSAPGYSVVTFGEPEKLLASGEAYNGVSVFYRYTKSGAKEFIRSTAELFGVNPDLADDIMNGDYEEAIKKVNPADLLKYQDVMSAIEINYSLLEMETLKGNDEMNRTMYGMIGIVLGIIVITSAFCIRNSFSISITEKTKQYGVLASIGATPKQIKKNVYYEAIILGVIGIPLGLLFGMLACLVLLKVVSALLAEFGMFELHFATSVEAIAIAVLFAVVMIYLSARKPARRAAKVSPIVAIRGNQDIKLTAKKLKTPKWVSAIFGIGGKIAYKNRKRNKKKYRVVVLSIMISVTVFMVIFSFTEMLGGLVELVFPDEGYNINFCVDEVESSEEAQDLFGKLRKREDVRAMNVLQNGSQEVKKLPLKYTDEAKKYMPYYEDMLEDAFLNVYFMNEKDFAAYCEQAGVEVPKKSDQAILMNRAITYEGAKRVYYDVYKDPVGTVIKGTYSMYGYREDDDINLKHTKFEIYAVAKEWPLGLRSSYSDDFLVVSENWLKENVKGDISRFGYDVYIDSEDADALQTALKDDYDFEDDYIRNSDKDRREYLTICLIINIFMYGFIIVIVLIGVTNIFNTVTTSMEVRRQEFATLQSIGMTPKQFRYMVRMESFFYATKSLAYGILFGSGLSYVMQKYVIGEEDLPFVYPWKAVIISVVAVVLLLAGIMNYSLRQIRKQNIIETIRQENI